MLVFRAAESTDYPYVIDSFWHGFKDEPTAQGCTPDFLTSVMRGLLNNPEWACTVLCESDTPDEILGYVVWKDPQTIAWICVKRAVQRNGFAHKLLGQVGCRLTLPILYPFRCVGTDHRILFGKYRPYLPFQ